MEQSDRQSRDGMPRGAADVTAPPPGVGAAGGVAPVPGGGGGGGAHPRSGRGLKLGTVLGKYRLVSVLGRGGMGDVYAAEDTLLKRRVAIKTLPAEMAGDAALRERFLAEAQSAARLNHPNVVTIYEVARVDGVDFIVMELVGGGTMADLVKQRGVLGWRAATRVIADACKGLAAAHERGLIHRDIKPANLMLTDDKRVKVADFGLAKAESSEMTQQTQPGAIVGTPAFMSPEQCRGEKLDARSDIYSLGCTYYALLSGRPPYEAASSIQVMFAHCSAPIPDPRDLNDDVPEACVEILKRSLAKDRGERYASAREMLEDLRGVLGGVTTMANAGALASLAEGTAVEAIPAPPLPPMAVKRAGLPGWVLGAVGGGVVAIVVTLLILVGGGTGEVEGETGALAPMPGKPVSVAVAPMPVEPAPVEVERVPAAVSPAVVEPVMPTVVEPVAVAKVEPEAVPAPEVVAEPVAVAPVVPPAPAAEEARPAVQLPGVMTNSVGQRLVLIPAGSFTMGDERLSDAPPHEVRITRPFYIAAMEVTQGEFLKVMGEHWSERVHREELPAPFESWDEARRFCERLSDLPEEKAAGRMYRLPTEAEWEYAARAGTTTRYAFGDALTEADANFGKKIDLTALRQRIESGGEPGDPPAPPQPPERPKPGQRPRAGDRRERMQQPGGVAERRPIRGADAQQSDDRRQRPLEPGGTYPANPWGLHDMHGSLWEFCSDFYARDAYGDGSARIDPSGPDRGMLHVVRGGAWNSPAAQCTSAYRNGTARPTKAEPFYGVRVVCEVKATAQP